MMNDYTDFDHGAICMLNSIRKMLVNQKYSREEIVNFLDEIKKDVFNLNQGKMDDVNFK